MTGYLWGVKFNGGLIEYACASSEAALHINKADLMNTMAC